MTLRVFRGKLKGIAVTPAGKVQAAAWSRKPEAGPWGLATLPPRGKILEMTFSRSTLLLIALLGGMGGVGCEEAPRPPDLSHQETDEAHRAPARPTTQELVSGERRKFPLTGIPITLSAPPSWAIRNLGGDGITVLEGPAPHGDAQIQFSAGGTGLVSELKLHALLQVAEKESTQPSTPGKITSIRREGSTVAIERLQPLALGPDGSGGDAGTIMRWRVQLYVPRDAEKFEMYELKFLDLPLAQYEKDEAFLRGIIESARHEPSGEAGGN
jgi:hypothetical protein